jgi:alpha-galactosidase
VVVRDEIGSPTVHQVSGPGWMAGPFEASGALLSRVGVPLPLLDPAAGLLLEVTAV